MVGTTCQCTQLSSFAVLMAHYDVQRRTLRVATFNVCCWVTNSHPCKTRKKLNLAWYNWGGCSDFYNAEIILSTWTAFLLRLRVLIQPSDFWQGSVPCGCQTEVSLSSYLSARELVQLSGPICVPSQVASPGTSHSVSIWRPPGEAPLHENFLNFECFLQKKKKAQVVFLFFFCRGSSFFVFVFVFLKLEDNCFTMLFWFQ